MTRKQSLINPKFYFQGTGTSTGIPLLPVCSILCWLLNHDPLLPLLAIVPVVSGFHVTQRSHHGDDVFGYMNDVNYATYTSTGKQNEERQAQPLSLDVQDNENILSTTTAIANDVSNISLVPLSTKPLLFVSSGTPVLSHDECQHLSSYFLAKTKRKNNENNHSKHKGQYVLEKFQQLLDELILRPEDTIVEPRYLFYERPTDCDRSDFVERKQIESTTTICEKLTGNNPILPDGLHVDTNNGKYFRYCTVLVYLTSSHAATVFPLANIHNHADSCRSAYCDVDDHKNSNLHQYQQQLQNSAEYLIQNHVQHTRQKVEVEAPSEFSSELKPNHQDLINSIQQKQLVIEHAVARPTCLRILPQMGHIAIFFNIHPQTGLADPYSFHGSEVSYDEKQVLTFFYELLPNTELELFDTPMEFGQRIQKRINRMHQKYNLSGH